MPHLQQVLRSLIFICKAETHKDSNKPVIIMYFFLFSVLPVWAVCCLNCASVVSSSCSLCASPYLLYKGVCVSLCGYGYSSNGTDCLANGSSLDFLSTSFATAYDYSVSSVGNFQTSSGLPLLSPNAFMPTEDRGFYSDGNSSLVGKAAWVPTNDFTLQLFFRPLQTNGILLQIIDLNLNPYINIQLLNGLVWVGVNTISQNDSSISQMSATNSFLNQNSGSWFNLLLQVYQQAPNMILLSIALSQGTQTLTLQDAELYITGVSQWVLGSLSDSLSLQGFYYKVEAHNQICSTFICDPSLNLCNFNYYYNYSISACEYCGSTCDLRMNCIDNLACSQCYFLQCSSCNGYLLLGCSACTNGETAPACCEAYCRSCSSIGACDVCQYGSYLYQGVCLTYSPYGGLTPLASPIITALFDVPFTGAFGVFATCTSATTYQFFQSPEKCDPIPTKQRGLYLAGWTVLNATFAIPHTFTIGMLVKPYYTYSMNLLNNGDFLVIQPFNTVLTAYMETTSASQIMQATAQIGSYTSWTFLSVSLNYSSPYSTVQVQVNGVVSFTTSLLGVYRAQSTSFIIGGEPTSLIPGLANYTGFIYNVYIWNTAITDLSGYSSFTVCTAYAQDSCMWECNFAHYLGPDSLCDGCKNGCSLGCVVANSCNICQDQLCGVCLDFGNTCISCVTYAQMVSGVCQCNSDAVVSDGSCHLCYTSCSTCFSTYNNGCLSCTTVGDLLVEGVCLSVCPDGFALAGTSCIATDYVVVELRLYDVSVYGVTQGVTIGSNNSTRDVNDPISCSSRGYYFTESTAMQASNKILFSIFSANLWIKIVSDGDIVAKGSNFCTITAAAGSFNTTVSLPVGSLSAGAYYTGAWEYYSIQFNISTGLTQLSLFRNSVLLTHNTTSTALLITDFSSNILIGSYTGSGFTGFLWSLGIYNSLGFNTSDFVITGCSEGCTQCPLEILCPSNCSIDYSPNNCTEPCPSACLTCNSLLQCSDCFDTAVLLSDFTCVCPDRFFWDDTSEKCIFPCFSNCTDCDQSTIGACYGCDAGFYLFNGVCVNCPSGYRIQGSLCVLNQPLVFDLTLVNSRGVVRDPVSGNEGIAGNSLQFYPDYDSSDPYFTVDRGYYFDGQSAFISFDSLILMIPPEFTFEIWFMPNMGSGVLFSKQNRYTLDIIAMFGISDGQMIVQLNQAPNGVSEMELGLFPILNQWNYFKFCVKSLENVNFEIIGYLNNANFTYLNFNKTYLSDNMDSGYAFIGTKAIPSRSRQLFSFSSFYNGFVYQIRIYNSFIESNSNIDCNESCDSCLPSHECLPSCSISEYWVQGSDSNCSECSADCVFGCRDNRTSCTLCEDLLCASCPDVSTCEECVQGASIQSPGIRCNCLDSYINEGNACIKCEGGYVQSNICVSCDIKCIACTSNTCIKCSANAELYNQKCYCKLGFSGTLTCNFVLFYANLSVSDENIIYIDFSDSLSITLAATDISITLDQNSVNFLLNQFTNTRYVIYLQINGSIINNTQILLTLPKLISSENGILNNTEFALVLNGVTVNTDNPVRLVYMSICQTAISVATYVAASLSMMNPNPAALWSFINSIQMLIYIYLVNIEISPRFTGYLLGLRKYQVFPNIFDYFDSYKGNSHQFGHAVELGFIYNSVFSNIGSWVSCFLFFVALYYTLYILHWILGKSNYKNSKLSKFLINKCEGYKYGFFLRFWIQAYLEIVVACFIPYYSSDLSNLGQAYNFYFSIIFGVIYIQLIVLLTPFVIFIIGFNNKNKSTEKTQTNLNVWASLFYEFKDDSGAAQSQFYTIFFTRRILFVTILFVLQAYPIIQMCLCEILMLAVFYK